MRFAPSHQCFEDIIGSINDGSIEIASFPLLSKYSVDLPLSLRDLDSSDDLLKAMVASAPEVAGLWLMGDNKTSLEAFRAKFPANIRLVGGAPARLEDVYEFIESVSKAVGLAAGGRDIVNRLRAQLLDWGSNFHERTRNKRVVVITNLKPLTIAGFWITDLIKLASAQPPLPPGEGDRLIQWKDIEVFRPDVLIMALRSLSLKEVIGHLKALEQEELWEKMPAVKRGDVAFMSGNEGLYRPSQKMISGSAILFSAIAGFDSGYITPRDSFYRLRWLELNRHKL